MKRWGEIILSALGFITLLTLTFIYLAIAEALL